MQKCRENASQILKSGQKYEKHKNYKKVLKIRKWLTYDYYPKFKLLTKKFELYNQMRIDIYTIWEEVFSFVPSAVTQPFF